MRPDEHLLIFGASARAAAFSALRAGLRPWCADCFADADLKARCPVVRLLSFYPGGFLTVAESAVVGPWMYTGGLENHPSLLRQLAACRRLWGNDGDTVARIRDPGCLGRMAKRAGLPTPEIATLGEAPRDARRWLRKPLHGSGGAGVTFWTPEAAAPVRPPAYLQEFIPGEPASAVYLGTQEGALLLGCTRQWIGVDCLHAAPFRYAGNVGPLSLAPRLTDSLGQLGQNLAVEGGLRGLFGVDGILRDGDFWPIEVNPRYPASVEVLEYATGLRALHLHHLAFEDEKAALAVQMPAGAGEVVGKAILYTRHDVVFPSEGPWRSTLADPLPVEQMPLFADLPHAGEAIPGGGPVLTLFVQGQGVEECEGQLRKRAAEVEEWLYP